ncbi:MAG TPA: nucleoside monophosphate kinase [Verrucomicrobiae bacterium]|nr:nucleoside monophosphate kinase [Verrucomicrobiae bacterium]
MELKNDRAAWLKGGNARCSIVPQHQPQPYRFVLLGAPGVGKGTQAQFLGDYFGACHLSTGDIFRCAKDPANGNPESSMKSALEFMNRGELVPDETVLKLVAERAQCLCCGGGILLDGFPRTVAQAKALEKLLASQNARLDAVVNFHLPLAKIIARLGGRRTCSQCKSTFHIESLPPKIEGVCDHCGGALFQRDDDRPEAIRIRMAAYNKNAVPLKRFYQRRNLLVTVEAAGTPDTTFARALDALAIFNRERFSSHNLPTAAAGPAIVPIHN